MDNTVFLNTNREMPLLGLGVYKATGENEAESAIISAVESGYRLIDTASVYKNEENVGRGIASCGIPRNELFITTKVWNTAQRLGDIQGAFERSLDRLKLDYVDLYLIHWPVPGCYLSTWKVLEEIQKSGRALSIGVSNFEIRLAKNQNRYGKMWECPDFFELDGKYVLLTSPQDMLPEGLEFHNGNGTLCIIGELDPETHTLKEQFCQGVDYGIDYYAMQTLLAPDGRRIMIAWMQNWDTLAYRCNDSGWFAQMSLPRELSVKNGRLYQVPVRELNAMRANKVEYNNVVIKDTRLTLDQIEGRIVDLELVIRPADKDNLYKKFELCFAENEKYHSTLCFRPDESVLKIDRKFSGSERALVHQSSCLVNGDSNELKLRVILDKFSVEVFINDGEQVMSAVILTKQEAKGISFFADGAVKLDIVKYDLL